RPIPAIPPQIPGPVQPFSPSLRKWMRHKSLRRQFRSPPVPSSQPLPSQINLSSHSHRHWPSVPVQDIRLPIPHPSPDRHLPTPISSSLSSSSSPPFRHQCHHCRLRWPIRVDQHRFPSSSPLPLFPLQHSFRLRLFSSYDHHPQRLRKPYPFPLHSSYQFMPIRGRQIHHTHFPFLTLPYKPPCTPQHLLRPQHHCSPTRPARKYLFHTGIESIRRKLQTSIATPQPIFPPGAFYISHRRLM